MAHDHVRGADVEPLDHRAEAGQVAAAQRGRRQARLQRAEAGAVERGHRGAVAGLERERARAGRSAVSAVYVRDEALPPLLTIVWSARCVSACSHA